MVHNQIAIISTKYVFSGIEVVIRVRVTDQIPVLLYHIMKGACLCFDFQVSFCTEREV